MPVTPRDPIAASSTPRDRDNWDESQTNEAGVTVGVGEAIGEVVGVVVGLGVELLEQPVSPIKPRAINARPNLLFILLPKSPNNHPSQNLTKPTLYST